MFSSQFPEEILRFTEGLPFSEDTVGCSDSHVYLYPEMVLKVEHLHETSANEAQMLRWLDGRLPAPRILAHTVQNGTQYLLMTRIKGHMACSSEYLSNPKRLAALLADALHTLWQLDTADCPHTTTLSDRLAFDEAILHSGDKTALAKPISYRNHTFSSSYALYDWLKQNQPEETPVFSHGDFCLPNVFFSQDVLTGFLDLGQAGISDKNYDLALCYRSLWYNLAGIYGGTVYPDAEKNACLLFEALGIKPDFDILDYYILLDMIGEI